MRQQARSSSATADLFPSLSALWVDVPQAAVPGFRGRRRLIHYAVTAHPTSEWVARQIVEGFPWDQTPAYLVRDRDAVYGSVVKRRLRGLGIRDRPIAPGSPWQNAYVERLIGSIRRECIDHVIILGEAHLRRIMSLYASYYKHTSQHPSVYVIEENRLC